jgi:hypothetical protein
LERINSEARKPKMLKQEVLSRNYGMRKQAGAKMNPEAMS